jgi:arylsulfatase A-like enzyme
MKRRQFLKAAGCAAVSLAFAGLPIPVAARAKRPNVLFIAVDDLNDWIGCLGGNPDAKSPNLDRLAARGVNFTRAYCSAPACNPSRASLMTGILPSSSGVYQNPDPWRVAMPEAVTLQQHFKAHDYLTIGRGKIYHGSFPDKAPGAWDAYIPKGSDPKPIVTAADEAAKKRHGKMYCAPIDGAEEAMDDYKVASWTIEQLNKSHDRPFFLACGFYKPHLPWHAPKKYFDMYPPEKLTLPNVKKDDLDDIPPIGRQMAKPQGDHRRITKGKYWRKSLQGYLACISFMDAQLGRVLDALDASAHRDNTIVVLWSDHGWHLGEKLHWRKFALWEEATHNVLMMTVPGLTRPGTRCKRPVNLIDLYPTLIELCGLTKKPELQGLSLLPLLKNPQAKRERPALTSHGQNRHSIRSERWRYIRYSDGTEELYDHDVDDMEWTNLAEKPEYAGVKKDLARWLPKVNVPPVPKPALVKKKTKRKANKK